MTISIPYIRVSTELNFKMWRLSKIFVTCYVSSQFQITLAVVIPVVFTLVMVVFENEWERDETTGKLNVAERYIQEL